MTKRDQTELPPWGRKAAGREVRDGGGGGCGWPKATSGTFRNGLRWWGAGRRGRRERRTIMVAGSVDIEALQLDHWRVRQRGAAQGSHAAEERRNALVAEDVPASTAILGVGRSVRGGHLATESEKLALCAGPGGTSLPVDCLFSARML